MTSNHTEEIRLIRSSFPHKKTLDDSTIKRFLIARNYDVERTVQMLQNHFDFRDKFNVDAIRPPNGVNVPFTMSVRKLFKDVNYDVNAPGVREEFKKFYPATGGMGVHGVDLAGHPLYIELLGKYNVKKMAELCDQEVMKQFCILNNEFLFGPVLDHCSKLNSSRIEKMTAIFDCTGMGLHQFHVPGIMLLKVVAALNQDYYPERLNKIFIVNAPVFFSAAWAIIKIGLDKRVLDKVMVLGSDYKSTLLKHIRHDQLPSFLGGTCTCSHMSGGCVPSPFEHIPADHSAFRYKTTLKKSMAEHEHFISLKESNTVNFKYESKSKISFTILKDSKIIYSSDELKLKDTRLALQAGVYIFKWKGIDLSYRGSSLNYTILYSFSHCDSGISLDSWVDEDGEIFYDAKECLCWYTEYKAFERYDYTFVDPLESILLDVCIDDDRYDGIVITSKRSLEATKNVCKSKPMFVVGPATAARAAQLGFTNIIGADSGSAIALADHIIKSNVSRLLLLTGDKNRDDLHIALRAANLEVELLKVYETIHNPNLQQSISQLDHVDWMVFFSPSGFDAVKPFVDQFPKIACIGNTTASYISSLGYRVDAIASKPDENSLLHAMFQI